MISNFRSLYCRTCLFAADGQAAGPGDERWRDLWPWPSLHDRPNPGGVCTRFTCDHNVHFWWSYKCLMVWRGICDHNVVNVHSFKLWPLWYRCLIIGCNYYKCRTKSSLKCTLFHTLLVIIHTHIYHAYMYCIMCIVHNTHTEHVLAHQSWSVQTTNYTRTIFSMYTILFRSFNGNIQC